MSNKIILAGNPNVGKSTLFNRLTGMSQHTGNWTGKTTGSALGYARFKDEKICVIDTPGTYSLLPSSADEEAARETICCEECDAIIVVCDACCLERGLYLALQIMEKRSNIILCLNMMDEAEKQNIDISPHRLSKILSVPVLSMNASRGAGIKELMELIYKLQYKNSRFLEEERSAAELKQEAHKIYEELIPHNVKTPKIHILDKALSNRLLACPIMLLMLFFILWLSIVGANYPSQLLSRLFSYVGKLLALGLEQLSIPSAISSAITDGIYGTTAWVVAVMLPPMAIFFPLFAIMEDWGLLPRIAFNTDSIFKKCGSSGKQALCMCMGLGCNAVGVCACRIIADKGEKTAAMLTNSFMPCNGRFPTLLLISALLFTGSTSLVSAGILLLMILLGAILSLGNTFILSRLFNGTSKAPFALELPPYRKPRIIHTVFMTLKTKTLSTLLRAVKVSAPAGLIIWLLANIKISGNNIIFYLRWVLETPGQFIGLDGAILLGFILGFPANEIVLPLTLMCSLSGSSLITVPSAGELTAYLSAIGWTKSTMLCFMVFSICHWPCATTLLTIKKESGRSAYALAAAIIPTMWGVLLCIVIRLLF